MHVPLVMSLIGQDRPGLVEAVASVVAEHGGNWLESRMCRLGGEFAGILRVTVGEEKQGALTQALKDLQGRGLLVVVQPDHGEPGAVGQREVSLELVGQDRPGIVSQITQVLSRHQVNVEEFSSECASAPMSGETLFQALAHLQIPASCNVPALRKELETIAGDLMVDITLKECPGGE